MPGRRHIARADHAVREQRKNTEQNDECHLRQSIQITSYFTFVKNSKVRITFVVVASDVVVDHSLEPSGRGREERLEPRDRSIADADSAQTSVFSSPEPNFECAELASASSELLPRSPVIPLVVDCGRGGFLTAAFVRTAFIPDFARRRDPWGPRKGQLRCSAVRYGRPTDGGALSGVVFSTPKLPDIIINFSKSIALVQNSKVRITFVVVASDVVVDHSLEPSGRGREERLEPRDRSIADADSAQTSVFSSPEPNFECAELASASSELLPRSPVIPLVVDCGRGGFLTAAFVRTAFIPDFARRRDPWGPRKGQLRCSAVRYGRPTDGGALSGVVFSTKDIPFYLKAEHNSPRFTYTLDDDKTIKKGVYYYTDYENCLVKDLEYHGHQCVLWVKKELKNAVPQICLDYYADICGAGVFEYNEDFCKDN
ncbi:hypothetical protein HPB50_007726 [Hyalomma asiaticum]|uniref:Uncharacterized protein n=1 Tax=Hyalomma asiaticum TaxID=266040 RepID=A0ACB7S888_HYAAI|nr:hypothetical protein HPB50_007726 [Hyalomma asiaticum]